VRSQQDEDQDLREHFQNLSVGDDATNDQEYEPSEGSDFAQAPRISIFHKDDETDSPFDEGSRPSHRDSGSHAGDNASDDSSQYTESVCAELPNDTKLVPPGAAWAAVANPSVRSGTLLAVGVAHVV
jgi:hypothetical protein